MQITKVIKREAGFEWNKDLTPATVLLRSGESRTHWVAVDSHAPLCGTNANRTGWAPRYTDDEVTCTRCRSSFTKKCEIIGTETR